MSEANLITTYLFHGQEFLLKMNAISSFLEISVTDKQSGEEWQCSYDHAYIENLTHKTGNFKQFDIFATMLKSGLLKTSDCISLDLLTYDDLEALRIRRLKSHCSRTLLNKQNNNRRYLILIYNVEFDRILYPLPLEYCGPPDPAILQATIRKLESELDKARDQLDDRSGQHNKYAKQLLVMQKNNDDLVAENALLSDEMRHLTRIKSTGKSSQQIKTLQNAIVHLEQSVIAERRSHHRLVDKLRQDKVQLLLQVDKLKDGERKLRQRLSQAVTTRAKLTPVNPYSDHSSKWRGGDGIKTVYKRDATAPAFRSRSLSPKMPNSRSENWAVGLTKPTAVKRKLRNATTRPKVRSRNSSASSGYQPQQRVSNYDLDDYEDYDEAERYNHDLGIVRSTSKDRRPSSLNRSGASVTSQQSSHVSRSTQVLKMKIKTSEDEFRTLEGRITALQKILKQNINL